MKKKLLNIIFLLCLNNVYGATWSLQVTDPNFELKYYKLDDKSFKPFMPKTSWRCYIGPTQKKDQLESRTIHCDYSVKKAGEFKLFASCDPNRPYYETLFELNDEKKLLNFKLMITCEFKSSTPS